MRPSSTRGKASSSGSGAKSTGASTTSSNKSDSGSHQQGAAAEDPAADGVLARQEIQQRQKERMQARKGQAQDSSAPGAFKLTSQLQLIPADADDHSPKAQARKDQMDRLDHLAAGVNSLSLGIRDQLAKEREVLEDLRVKVDVGNDLVKSAQTRAGNLNKRI